MTPKQKQAEILAETFKFTPYLDGYLTESDYKLMMYLLYAYAKGEIGEVMSRKEIIDTVVNMQIGEHDLRLRATELADALVGRVKASERVEACSICGSALVWIRGRYPKQDKRKVCPTCCQERLEYIYQISSNEYGKAYCNKDTGKQPKGGGE